MEASSSQSAEDHDHTSDISVISQKIEQSIHLNEDMGTQKTNFQEHELYHVTEEETEEEETGDLETEVEETGDLETEEQETRNLETGDLETEEPETGDEEEFSFTFDGEKGSPISAEDAFINGEIKPMFPLFNQELLKEDRYFKENLGENPKVKKVLFKDSSENDEISGPYCEWKGKPPAEKEGWKKSNSTGFSKLWKLKELVNRSNSDGRDAFVFLNNDSTTNKDKEKMIKGGKKKTASLSSHEIYLKNKAKENENDRRKSYMPYKPEMFGFFTNVNGGISKNVHPY